MSKPDNNLLSFAGRRPLGTHFLGDLVANPEVYADALKVTDCDTGTIYAGRVVGGAEDCIDINNHTSDVEIIAGTLEPQGKFIATIKGGSRNITLRSICVIGHGSEVDIDLGNISDQSDDVTGPVKLALKHRDGDVITVRVLGASRPIFLNEHEQKYEVVFALPKPTRSIFLKIYKFLKKLGLPI